MEHPYQNFWGFWAKEDPPPGSNCLKSLGDFSLIFTPGIGLPIAWSIYNSVLDGNNREKKIIGFFF